MFRVHSTSSHQITHFACEIPLKVEEPVPEAQASEQQERSQGLLNVTSRKRRRIRCFHVKAMLFCWGKAGPTCPTAPRWFWNRRCGRLRLPGRQPPTLAEIGPAFQPSARGDTAKGRRLHQRILFRGGKSWTGVFLQPSQFGGRRDVPVEWEQHFPAGLLGREDTARG